MSQFLISDSVTAGHGNVTLCGAPLTARDVSPSRISRSLRAGVHLCRACRMIWAAFGPKSSSRYGR